MNTDERLAFCRKCTNRKFDQQQGIICRLTEKKADFEDSCPDFNDDPSVKEKLSDFEPKTMKESMEMISEFSEDAKDRFRKYEDFSSAIIGGLLLSLVGASLWAALVVLTERQMIYAALGLGALVGVGVRYFGAGIDQKYGILGGVLGLVSCLTGNVMAYIAIFAQEGDLSFLEAFGMVDWVAIIELIQLTFSPIDLLFYGAAVFMAYRFSFRTISAHEINNLNKPDFDPVPPGYEYRRIAGITASVILAVVVFVLL